MYFRISSNALDTWIRCTEASRRSCSTCSRCCSSSRSCLSLAYMMVVNLLPCLLSDKEQQLLRKTKLEAASQGLLHLTKATALSVLLSLRVKGNASFSCLLLLFEEKMHVYLLRCSNLGIFAKLRLLKNKNNPKKIGGKIQKLLFFKKFRPITLFEIFIFLSKNSTLICRENCWIFFG